jgi:electron transfer flavoprotein alpha subunit
MTTLVIAEHDNTTLKPATLNTVTAAVQCGAEVHLLVAGHNAASVASAAAQVAGVAKVLHIDAESLAHGIAENVTAQVQALAAAYSHILFAATASGKNIAPRVAAKLDVAQLSDITQVISPDTFERPIYAGNAMATVQTIDAVRVITVRTTAFDPAAQSGQAPAAIEVIAPVAASAQTVYLGSEIAKNDRPELTAAKVIVSGGRALGSQEKFNEV